MSDRLLPSTWPRVETHTKTLDVGVGLSTLIVLDPGFSVVAGTSTVVSSSDAGVGVCAARICTAVPVLLSEMVTSPTLVGCGNCSISPTPFLKFGNGTGSVYVSIGHTVAGLPSMASAAWSGASASPPGENTVT